MHKKFPEAVFGQLKNGLGTRRTNAAREVSILYMSWAAADRIELIHGLVSRFNRQEFVNRYRDRLQLARAYRLDSRPINV